MQDITTRERLTGALTETAKATPPAGVTGMHLAGVPLSDWLVGLTVVYTAMLLVHKAIEIYRALRRSQCEEGHHHRRSSDRLQP